MSSPFIIDGCTPLTRCLCNSSLSILVCIGKVFACCLHQEHKRLHVVHSFYTISALSFIWELFFSLHLLSHFSTSLDHGYSCTISVCPRAIYVLQISPYSLLMFDSSSSCHNICPSQNRMPIFISLLYFSSIIRVFINSTLEKSQSPNLTFWRNHHSIRSLNLWNPTVPLCCRLASLQPFHFKLLYIRK